MSLQVWLPLTKDLRNQGLSNVTVTNNGATFNSAGKLGGCYSFGTGNSYITVDSTPLKTFTEFSFACWVKIISWNTSYSTIFAAKNSTSVSWNNLIFSLLRNSSNSTLCFNISNGSSYTSTNCQTGTLSLNTWYHIVCTYKSGEIKLYQDGGVVSTYNTSVVPNFNSIVNLWIGKSNENSYQSNNLLNDVRIYDHCLSPMEVKELSKGLVLHYPLNRGGFGQENLATCTTPQYNMSASTGNYNYFWIVPTGTLTVGETYTFSAEATVSDNVIKSTIYNYNTNPTTSGPQNNNFKADGTRDSWTFTASATGLIAYAGVAGATANKTAVYKNIKLEKGDKATPYIPRSNEALYTTMGLNGTTEYDCSGFCNNGTRTGTFSWTSDTPKYSVSQYFNGSSYILTDSGTFSWFGFDKCTLAAWFKPTVTPSQYTGTIGISHNQNAGHKSFCIGNYAGYFTVCTADGSYINTTSNLLPNNEWHHCVATLDGTTVKMYIDGVLVKTYTLSWGSTALASDMRFQVGIDLPGSDEMYTGYYSDIRAYVTALSADDVKSLYQNCATIDSNGTIRGQIRN